MSQIAIIGDVHGKHKKYLDIIKNYKYSIQVGDFGYNYECLNNIDYKKHKFIAGNHDQHDDCYNIPHCLGRFGYASLARKKFFFVSGGFSIDQKYRMKAYYSGEWPQTYFFNEELSLQEQNDCYDLYYSIKPDVVISHECPRSIVNSISNPDQLINWGFDPKTFTTQTSELLQGMLECHAPKLWFFGHYHVSKQIEHRGCTFKCIPEHGVELW